MLEEIDYDVSVFSEASRQADKNLAVRFFVMPMQNDVKTTEQGRPIFDDTEFVEIRVRGDRNNIINRPARDEDRRRFRDAYLSFKDQRKELDSGTPLSQWPIMSMSMVEELKYLGFHTVEQVSEASEQACAKVSGLTSLRQKAKIYLEHANGGAPLEKLAADNKALQDQLAAMQAQMAEMSRRLEAQAAPQAVKKA